MSSEKLHRNEVSHQDPAPVTHAADSSGGGSGAHDGYYGSVGGAPLAGGTRSTMESAFGQGFGDVRVHADSPSVGGSVQAKAQGSDLHFAPGKYQPGTAQGDRLVAHELAHVVQQRGGGESVQNFDPAASHGLLEADADRAADRAVAGQSADVRFRATAGSAQLYESWEHHQLGTAGGGGRTLTLKCGITLTYGEVVAMSGDFYASPEALMNAPRSEVERIQAIMARERSEAAGNSGHVTEEQENENNHDYQAATDWREQTQYDSTGHQQTTGHNDDGSARSSRGEAAGTESQSYLTLADNNSTHFSPDNINLRWRPQHDVALGLARQAHAAGQLPPAPTPGAPAPTGVQGQVAAAQEQATRQVTLNNPQVQAAQQDQQRRAQQNAPATQAATVAAQNASNANGDSAQGADKLNNAYLHDGFACHFLTDAFASGHLISGDVGRRIGPAFWTANRAAILAALKMAANADNPHVPHQAVDFAVDKAVGVIESHVGSLCLKLVHDALNNTGMQVINPRGDMWETKGDGSLADAPKSQVYGAEAVQLSREAVEETARTGNSADPYKAMTVVPSVIMFKGAAMSISAFTADPKIFEGYLKPLLLDSSTKNPLWVKIKGNIGLVGQMGGEWATDKARAGYAAGQRAYNAASGAVQSGVQHVENAGRAVVNGVENAGRAAVNGVENAGRSVANGAGNLAHKGAAWVESLF
jgi:hypothetical protein